jgi:hypothetical protein
VRRAARAFAETVAGTPAPLPPAHAEYLASFQPSARVRAEQRDAVRASTVAIMNRAGHIKGLASFIKRTSDAAALATWAAAAGRPMDWQSLMAHSTIHDFARAHNPGTSPANLAHRVRRLEILASTINPGPDALPRPAKVPHAPVAPPYTPAEMRAIERVARAQRSLKTARGLQTIIGFCRGAGASSSELLSLHRADVDDQGADGILVTLGEGLTRRTIPVRRAYEPWVRAAITDLAPDNRVLPGKAKNAIGHILETTEILSTDLPKIEVARLRTTWIAELMTLPIPLNALLAAAGLRSVRTISDIYAHLALSEPPDERLLRGDA